MFHFFIIYRLIKTTLLYGFVGTIIATTAFGPDVSFPYFLGSGAGAFYLYLLGKKTDKIGSGNYDLSQIVLAKLRCECFRVRCTQWP